MLVLEGKPVVWGQWPRAVPRVGFMAGLRCCRQCRVEKGPIERSSASKAAKNGILYTAWGVLWTRNSGPSQMAAVL